MKRLVLLLAFLAFALPLRAADSHFDKANQEFAAGNYKAAIANYEAEVAARRWSANLFYDLGNAWFRTGNLGHAILNYDRALQLESHHPEAEASLRLARDQTRGLEFAPNAAEKYFGGIGLSRLTVAAAIFFWVALLLIVLSKRRIRFAGAFLALTATAVCVWAVYGLEHGARGIGGAIVVADNAEARVATADTAKAILALPAGSEVVILQERGNWDYARLPNNQTGWISANAAEKIRL